MTDGVDWKTSSDRRSRRIAETCELVVQVMNLRPPQAESLRRVASLIQRLPRPLADCSVEERRSFLTAGETWQHAAHPTFTLALATGVGKTRLAGAIMALLYLARESRTVLVLAPRRAVLRRVSDALNPQFREYIFVEPGLVPEPYVVTNDLIADPAGVEAMPDMFRAGPTVYLLSPQLISTSERFRGEQAYTGKSPLEHLRGKADLVVLFDEAHHVGGLGQAEAARWTEAIRELRPAIQVGLTATPRGEQGENLLFEYPLSRALIEQLYVKDVHLLVRNFEGSLLSEEDVDQATIAYALDRLSAKESAIAACAASPFPGVKPVCVFFARDIAHAEWVASVLRDRHGLLDAEVLVTHSRSSKADEEVERLLSIESLANPVRVVVNVQELTEGWDVRNVYVVAPLRAMASFQGALQSMGRGLRLPAGRRIGQPEIDSLDVVCFGKQSLQRIVEEATSWLGRKAGDATGGVVVDAYDAGPRVVLKLVIAKQREALPMELVELEPIHEEVSLSVDPAAIKRIARMAVDDLDLVKLRSKFAQQKLVRVSRNAFIHAATMRVLRVASKYLSDDVHYSPVRSIIETWLNATDVGGDQVDFDPAEVGEELGRIVVDGARRRALQFQATGRSASVDFADYSVDIVRLVSSGQQPPEPCLTDLPITTESTFTPGSIVRGLDDHAWTLSLHPAYSFDSFPEVRLAWLLDHDGTIDWWVRNEPRRLRIRTPAGMFSPDFVVRLSSGELYIIEVKGSVYWDDTEGEARVRARSACMWAERQTELTGAPVEFGVALDSDVKGVQSFAVLRERLLKG